MDVHFTATTEHQVRHLRFGQPGVRNLMDDAWFDALEAHLGEADRDPAVRVVLLSAEGDAFCSGANLKGVQHGLLSQGYEQSALARLLRRLTTFEKPLVAAVHGLAIGGGTTLLLHCDFVYAAEGTRFQMPFAKLGLVPEFGSSYLLPLNAGMRLASELVLLARHAGVERQDVAHAHGLLEHELVHRHRGHAALHVARGQHRTGQVDLGHDPAAEDVAVAIGVRRHGNDLEHQLLAVGQCGGGAA